MADEPKPNPPAEPSARKADGISAPDTSISPAPNDVHEQPTDGDAPPPLQTSPTIPAEPLTDGTVPTIITAGDSHRKVAKGKASLTRVYRRADILTTVLTAGGVVLALLVIGGVYLFFANRNKPVTATPKITALDKSDLDKLGAYFQGNAAGTDGEVLTINSSTLFKNRVATSSDLKVLGGAEITGPTVLGDLTADKTSTLGVTNIRGQLTVAGPTSLKGALLLSAGASISGNLSVTGTGSFGGALSAATLNVTDISVAGTLNLAGHLSMSGLNPSVSPGSEAGAGATTSIEGNDAAGSVTFNTGTMAPQLPPVGGLLAKITFRNPYPRTPKVLISPVGQNGAALQYYVLKTNNYFIIGSNNLPNSNTSYAFDYWVVQ